MIMASMNTDSLAHPVSVHEQITKHAVANAQLYSQGYTNFINTISVASSCVPRTPFIAPSFIPQSSTAFNMHLIYNPTELQVCQDPDFACIFTACPSDLMVFGSRSEDDATTGDHGSFMRSMNHFYNPLNQQGLSDLPLGQQFPFGISYGIDSFTWGSLLNSPWGITPLYNQWSWQNARSYEWYGLVSSDPAVRSANLAAMFRACGQFCHLLEDTSQPQHVRNEQHLEWLPCYRSSLEDYEDKHCQNLDYTCANLDWRNAGFARMQDFWNRYMYTGIASGSQPLNSDANATAHGGSLSSLLGLAEYCNGNFIGERASYEELVNPSNMKWKFPFPSLNTSTDWPLKQQGLLSLLTRSQSLGFGMNDGSLYLSKTGDGILVTHHSRLNYFPLVTKTSARILVHSSTINDQNVMNDYLAILIPKTVQYTEALLDYYFRGCLSAGATPNTDGSFSLSITNTCTQPLSSGQFLLFYDDASGNRTQIGGGLFNTLACPSSLAPGASFVATFKPASTAVVYVLVFNGSIGPTDRVDAGFAIATCTFVAGYPPHLGFKVVQAQKQWQGTFGYLDEPQPDVFIFGRYNEGGICKWIGIRTNAPSVKYRTAVINVSLDLQDWPSTNASGIEHANITYGSTYTVDRYSGIVTCAGCTNTSSSDNGDFTQDLSFPLAVVGLSRWGEQQYYSIYQLLCAPGTSWAPWNVTYPGAGQDGENILATSTLALTETQYTLSQFEYTTDNSLLTSNTCVENLQITITLSDPYSATDLDADCNTLLSTWDLTDDAQYPFRNDALITSTPFVTYNETFSSPFDAFQESSYQCGWADPNTGYYDGSIVGYPTPAGITGLGPTWCPQATQWFDDTDSQCNSPGAYSSNAPGSSVLIKQKWAEEIMYAKQSHNFDRPCGANDRAQIDTNTIDCATNPNGSPRWPDAPDCSFSNNISPKGDFITRTSTFNYRTNGEYARLVAQSNMWYTYGCNCSGDDSDYPNYAGPPGPPALPTPISTEADVSTNLSDFQITQQNLSSNSIYPSIVFITPNGERTPNSITLPMPTNTIDVTYGSFAISDVQQWMVDPLWQNPAAQNCAGTTNYVADDGSGGQSAACQQLASDCGCNIVFYPVPYEEARVAPPAGAPALPTGVLMGATNIGTTNLPNWVGPLFGYPQAGAANNFAPWVYYSTQLNYGCNLGTNVYFQIP
jgi:hypothetical protein